MRTYTLLFIILLLSLPSKGKEKDYNVATITDSLKQNANAVIRNYNAEYFITGPNEYTLLYSYSITILNEKGKKYARFVDYYNKTSVIDAVEGALYNSAGEKVNTTKQKDIIDELVFDISVADDSRKKTHNFNSNTYPYTVEYVVEKKVFSTFNIESWAPLQDLHCSLEQGNLSVEYPANFPLRYKLHNCSASPTPAIDAEKRKLAIQVSGIKAITYDNFSHGRTGKLPYVTMAADTFVLYGVPGTMKSWNDFGRFFYALNRDRTALPEPVKQKVHQLTDTCKTTQNKIAVLYNYLQNNTRYVSIQLGLGGWQTFDANFVCEKKYGDCKALSNFMVALLKEAGITGYHVVINAGDERTGLDRDFPAHSFNHMIVCVPLSKDTVWLECTSQNLPPGYLSSFTDNRDALMITPEGGVIARTPGYNKNVNYINRKVELTLGANDEVAGTISTRSSGSLSEGAPMGLLEATESEQNSYLNSAFQFPSYKVMEKEIKKASTNHIPVVEIIVKINADASVARTGQALTVGATGLRRIRLAEPQTDTTSALFELQDDFVVNDTVILHLDDSYTLASIKNELARNYSFGSYKYSCKLLDPKTVLKTTSYSLNAGNYPISEFRQYANFYKEITQVYNGRMAMQKL